MNEEIKKTNEFVQSEIIEQIKEFGFKTVDAKMGNDNTKILSYELNGFEIRVLIPGTAFKESEDGLND